MCLKQNKAVLCEKPMGMNAKEVWLMIEEARSRNLFLMEGLWTRFIPATEKLIELLAQDVIGHVISIQADFGFKGDSNPENRIFNKNLGGGSLLDIGIYPIYLSLLVLGIPTNITATAQLTETGVDRFCSMEFHYENGAKVDLESTIEADTPTEAFINGTTGTLKLHRRFHHTEKITHTHNDEDTILDIKYKGNGYIHEIEEVNSCFLNRDIESSKLPLQMSLDLSVVMDTIKNKIGLKYDSQRTPFLNK
jgi:predicted dehydrogenase